MISPPPTSSDEDHLRLISNVKLATFTLQSWEFELGNAKLHLHFVVHFVIHFVIHFVLHLTQMI